MTGEIKLKNGGVPSIANLEGVLKVNISFPWFCVKLASAALGLNFCIGTDGVFCTSGGKQNALFHGKIGGVLVKITVAFLSVSKVPTTDLDIIYADAGRILIGKKYISNQLFGRVIGINSDVLCV